MMWSVLVAVLTLAVNADLVKGVPQFKENAAEFMEVGFNKGRAGTRVTEIAVTVKISEMFKDGDAVGVDDLILEIKENDGCWTKVAEGPVRRGREKQMWRVKVIPCKEHSIRIGIKRDECVDYFQHPETVGPASVNDIVNSHYRPNMPENIVVTLTGDDSVLVSWSKSECAESYDLWYESASALDLGNMTIPAVAGSVTILGLDNCTEYTVKVVAILGDEFSTEGEADFTTCMVNNTEISSIETTEETNDGSCREVDTQCHLSKLEIEDLSNEGMMMVEEEDIDWMGSVNETLFDAQTGKSSSSYQLFISCLLSIIMILLPVM